MKVQSLVIAEMDNGVFNVQLSRPPANAVNVEMYIELQAVFSRIDDYCPGVRCVVLSAAGKHFCAGNDLDEFATMTPENGSERMWRVREAFFAIAECAVPVIGAVHGTALGTGLAIAASCDFVVASEDAKFGLPELTVGVMGGARHLARLAPQPLVRRMYFTGEHISARELARTGAALLICENGQLLEQAFGLARRIASFSPTAVRVSKIILDRIEHMDLRSGYETEQAGTVRMSGHPDAKEALRAFRERRLPRYEPASRDQRWYEG